MVQERERQIETIKPNCHYCGPGHPAAWEIVSDKGLEFVCGGHHFVLDEIHAIEKERPLCETEWKTNSRFGAEFSKDETDQSDDGLLMCL